MRSLKFWKKILRYQQEDDWCGPAVIQMVLASAGIRKAQKEIAKEVMHKWWGTTQHSMLAYFSRFFKKYYIQDNSTLSDLENYLKKGYSVVVNWMDDLSPQDKEGHYSLAISLNRKKKTLILADPGGKRGIWEIKIADFEKKWYDYLDLNGKYKISRWLLWVDPKSRI